MFFLKARHTLEKRDLDWEPRLMCLRNMQTDIVLWYSSVEQRSADLITKLIMDLIKIH